MLGPTVTRQWPDSKLVVRPYEYDPTSTAVQIVQKRGWNLSEDKNEWPD